MKYRLEWFLENKNLLPSHQFAYRKGKSTTDALRLLTSNIFNSFAENKIEACTSIGIKGAYDQVCLTTLCSTVLAPGIPQTNNFNKI